MSNINLTTFWSFINDNNINIPIIQRDYAQGRVEEEERRNRFLTALYDCLTVDDKKINLDFIYGRIDKKSNTFFPIDGQQRLTTLFLIYWYISLKEGIDSSKREVLTKFIYDTRISSRDFCKSLVKEICEMPINCKGEEFIELIKDSSWYKLTWDNDPTIVAMLIMIQAIDCKFRYYKDELWTKLTDTDTISFNHLDLGARGFDLTDDLYIKMNARGKQLTQFENFKADFIGFLELKHKNKMLEHPYDSTKECSYSNYFSFKIEKEWTDIMWLYKVKNKDEEYIVDTLFMKLFEYIAQMCYYKNNPNALTATYKGTISQIKDIFTNEDDLLFLFDFLDKLHEISIDNGKVNEQKLEYFFSAIFLQSSIDKDSYNGELRLFKNGSINLFKQSIGIDGEFENRNQIILYCIMLYIIKYDLNTATEGLRNYIRVVRNLIQATRQGERSTSYDTNVRINYFGSYWTLFEKLCVNDIYIYLANNVIDISKTSIAKAALENEQIKAKLIVGNKIGKSILYRLEEFNYFGGLIHALNPDVNFSKFNKYAQDIRDIWSLNIPDSLIIRSFIVSGFKGVMTKWGKMGHMWFFGNKTNWTRVLTSDDKEVSTSLISLLDTYDNTLGSTPTERLDKIISNWLLNNQDDRTWKYYFIKYPEFTHSCLNYYAWDNDFEVRQLSSDSSSPLLAYHISPYVYTVGSKIDNVNICDLKMCYQQYSGNKPLVLICGTTLRSMKDGWAVNFVNKVNHKLISDYEMSPYLDISVDSYSSNECYLLKDTPDKDRIQIAIEFIKQLYQN